MRIPRSIQLISQKGSIHKFWQCHNKAFLLKSFRVKELYLKCTEYALKHKSIAHRVRLSSFCIMSNHAHMHLTYEGSSKHLSNFMRISHSRFGFFYNKLFNRSGKVANERPKTPLIEDKMHSMRVHFYIESNPLRARMMSEEQLRLFKHSSYGFYAYGIKTKWTSLLTVPDWYFALGRSWKARRLEYRRLFKVYSGLKTNPWLMLQPFIGNPLWSEKMLFQCKQLLSINSS